MSLPRELPPAPPSQALVGADVFFKLDKGHNKGKFRSARITYVREDGKCDLHVFLRGEHDNGMGETRTAAVCYRASVAQHHTADAKTVPNGSWVYSVPQDEKDAF